MAADFIVAIAVKVGEFALAPIGNSFSYLYYYNKNITSFQNRVSVLVNTTVEIQGLVDEAKRNGELILPHVEEWLTTADGFVEGSRDFLNNHQVSPSCTGLASRYRVSKKAKKRVSVADKLLLGGKFDRVSLRVPPPLWSASTGDVEVFESRRSTFQEIMEALKDDNISIIGVYGMGGIGKTTLVKEVAKQASEDKLFDDMVMSVLSQTPNVRNIQGEIADKLGLKFDQESESGRAIRLCERLKQSEKVLIILDDVWRLPDLEAVGIPHNDVHNGCKLLLTSRSRDVCNEMNAQVCFPVKVLSKSDAWNLFSKMAGGALDAPDMHLLATKVAERCAGLPIAIVTVARALRGKSKHVWSDALRQLENPPTKNIKGMQKNVYSSLELSFTFLETDEMKSCFLLCSLFKEDAEIPVEYLVRYGMGLRLFQNVYKLEEARDRAYAVVEGLKACCLLLDGKSEEYVRMHDVIRDFAILIASSGQNMFLIRHGTQSLGSPNGDALNPYSAISLASTNIAELPGGLDCPNLEILLLHCHSDSMKVPGNFFEGMKQLKALTMTDMPILSIPSSIRSLWRMRTLCLERCKLRDISSIGELKGLEVLSLVGSNIKRLPKEIGQLTELRLLDLTDCEELTSIPAQVLSRLSLLESLNMMNSFVNWSGEEEDAQGSNASLSELKTLSCLRTLEVNILDVNIIPNDLVLENLIRFKIYVGSYWLVSLTHRYATSFKLRVDQIITLQDGVRMLLQQAQYLILEYCPRVLKSVLYDLKREGFQNLRGLELYGNSDIEYLVDTSGCKSGTCFPVLEKLELASMENLREIFHGHLPAKSFCELRELDLNYLPEFISLWKDTQGQACLGNLRNVCVQTCHKLDILFPQLVERDLGLLHDLRIFNCHSLRGIVSSDTNVVREVMGEILLPKLNFLELSLLPHLRNFCPMVNETSTSDVSHDIPLFGDKVNIPEMVELQLRELPRVNSLWHRELPEGSFGRLKVLRITSCHGVSKVIPSYMMQRLKDLESLSVINCDMVEEVCELEGLINLGEDNAASVFLPPLKELVLCRLLELKHIWWNKGSIGFRSLQFLSSLTISRCDSLTYIFSLSALKGLVQLQRLEIESCELVKEIVVGQDQGEGSSTVVFPQLHTLRLYHLPDLTSFYKEYKAFDWPSLKILTIANCPKMKTFPAAGLQQIVDQEGNLCATVQPLFSDEVAFPNTEELHIQWMDNLVEIWHNQLPDQTFSSLQVLDVRGCGRLLDVGPTNMLPTLQMLNKLYIEDCGSVEEIFVTEDLVTQDASVMSLFSLTELRLKSLPKLKHIWWDKSSQCGTLHFQNLTSLEVSGCHHLKYILPTSVLKGLVQIQELKISSCELVEEIVVADITVEDLVEEVVVLPRAKTLQLQNLPNLKSFCTVNCMLQLPSLKKLKIVNCPTMRVFGPIPNQRSFRMENGGSDSLDGNFSILIQPFFNEEVFLPILEKLSIEGLSSLSRLWHNQPPSYPFGGLKSLKVKRCEKLLTLVPNLKNLEKLCVEECDSLEDVLGIGPSFWKGHESHQICNLRDFELQNLPKLVEIWWNKDLNGILKYPKFSSLKIIKCDGLTKIFSLFVVRHFVHLEELYVANCLTMKAVVVEDEQKGYTGDKIVFPQLHSLGLVNLPDLQNFCSGPCTFEFPSLEIMNLEGCPNMRTFSLRLPVTPKLTAIEVENEEEVWKDDLNSTVQHLFKVKNLRRRRREKKEKIFKKLTVRHLKRQKAKTNPRKFGQYL